MNAYVLQSKESFSDAMKIATITMFAPKSEKENVRLASLTSATDYAKFSEAFKTLRDSGKDFTDANAMDVGGLEKQGKDGGKTGKKGKDKSKKAGGKAPSCETCGKPNHTSKECWWSTRQMMPYGQRFPKTGSKAGAKDLSKSKKTASGIKAKPT